MIHSSNLTPFLQFDTSWNPWDGTHRPLRQHRSDHSRFFGRSPPRNHSKLSLGPPHRDIGHDLTAAATEKRTSMDERPVVAHGSSMLSCQGSAVV